DVGSNCNPYNDVSGNVGILSTPAIDTASQTIYVVAKTKKASNQFFHLHAIDFTTGKERPGSPQLIQGTAPGSGDGSNGGMLTFDASVQNQRAAITLANGQVYIAFSSYCDTGDYHGWVLAYDKTTLAQTHVFVDTPNGGQGGIWQSGQGL